MRTWQSWAKNQVSQNSVRCQNVTLTNGYIIAALGSTWDADDGMTSVIFLQSSFADYICASSRREYIYAALNTKCTSHHSAYPYQWGSRIWAADMLNEYWHGHAAIKRIAIWDRTPPLPLVVDSDLCASVAVSCTALAVQLVRAMSATLRDCDTYL